MNKYEIIKTLGSGAFGDVYKARHKEKDELCAIKVKPLLRFAFVFDVR